MDMTRFRLMLLQGVADPHAACCYHKKDSEAPDYTPMANASVEAAQIADRLGRDQMAQARQLHDETVAFSRPILDAQIRLSEQQIRQGDDYYDYMKSQQRPLEQAMATEAQSSNAQDVTDRELITGGDTAIYNARQGEIDADVGRAVADARAGQSATTGRMIREAARYGWSPEKLASMAGAQGLGMASQEAAAANATRTAGIDKTRGLLTQNYNLRKAQEATQWGKKMDVAGLYRNLAGASQGSYGLALGAGNAAIQNQMAPGANMMAQNQGAMGTIMQGQGQRIQGLGSVLNSQTQMAGLNASQGNNAMSTIGSLAGAALAFS